MNTSTQTTQKDKIMDALTVNTIIFMVVPWIIVIKHIISALHSIYLHNKTIQKCIEKGEDEYLIEASEEWIEEEKESIKSSLYYAGYACIAVFVVAQVIIPIIVK